MQRWLAWLAWLAGLAGWLGWLMEGSLTRSTLWGGRRISNPKDDKTKDDAMIGVYPLECPKPII